MITESILICPQCEHAETEPLYENVNPTKFTCNACKQTFKINQGECCIYCSFADTPCLNAQIIGSACCNG